MPSVSRRRHSRRVWDFGRRTFVCGIAGQFNFQNEQPVDPAFVRRMARVLSHRGPDDEDIFVDGRIGLGHRRLSIIDLSGGKQPMQDETGRFTIVFNGEIYNYCELKETLLSKGYRFRTQSDTEVLLNLYRDKGSDCLEEARGMFAFAIWDSDSRQLFLARDRLGKKPLFYAVRNGTLFFGSEIKAILESPDVSRTTRPASIDDYLTYGYTPSPFTMFEGIMKLPPAHWMRCDRHGVTVQRYWSLSYEPKQIHSREAWREKIWSLLSEAVRLRLRSDVPLGVLLSGGLDSSTIVALIRECSGQSVRTFSIGFEESDYSELKFAREVARHFGTEHHELIVRPDAAAILPKLIWHYNEPFGDSSCIPTYYVSQLTRRHVKVALSGDGGDEAFAGYDRYRGAQLAMALSRLPRPVLRSARSLCQWLADHGPRSDPKRWRRPLNFLEALVEFPNSEERYLRWVSIFSTREKEQLYADHFNAHVRDRVAGQFLLEILRRTETTSVVDQLLKADTQSYLPEDLLVKMDIASMAHGLEIRSPFLDHIFLETIAQMPADFKLHRFQTKFLLREIVSDRLPRAVLNRRKMGFAVPIDHWFRSSLRRLVEEVLLDPVTLRRGLFKRSAIEKLLREHRERRRDHRFRLWALLNLELWHRTFIDRRPAEERPATTYSYANE